MNNIVPAQYYANEVCNSCATIAAFVASFIADVISLLAAAIVACRMFYCSCNRGIRDGKEPSWLGFCSVRVLPNIRVPFGFFAVTKCKSSVLVQF